MIKTIFTILIFAQVASCQSKLPEEDKSRGCTDWCLSTQRPPPINYLVETLVTFNYTDLTHFCTLYKEFKQCLDQCAEGVAKAREVLNNVPRRYVCSDRYDDFTKWVHCSHRMDILLPVTSLDPFSFSDQQKCECGPPLHIAAVTSSRDTKEACRNADCYGNCSRDAMQMSTSPPECSGMLSTLLKDTLREVIMSRVKNIFEAENIPKALYPDSCKQLASDAGAVKVGPLLLGAAAGILIWSRMMLVR